MGATNQHMNILIVLSPPSGRQCKRTWHKMKSCYERGPGAIKKIMYTCSLGGVLFTHMQDIN